MKKGGKRYLEVESLDEETGEMFDYYINSTNRAERLMEKIKEKGTIDLSYWIDVTGTI